MSKRPTCLIVAMDPSCPLSMASRYGTAQCPTLHFTLGHTTPHSGPNTVILTDLYFPPLSTFQLFEHHTRTLYRIPYRQRNRACVRSTISGSCWTMGSTPSHMAKKISERRWRVFGRVRSCFSSPRMTPRARVCSPHTDSIPTWFNNAHLRSRCGRLEARPHSTKQRSASWMG